VYAEPLAFGSLYKVAKATAKALLRSKDEASKTYATRPDENGTSHETRCHGRYQVGWANNFAPRTAPALQTWPAKMAGKFFTF